MKKTFKYLLGCFILTLACFMIACKNGENGGNGGNGGQGGNGGNGGNSGQTTFGNEEDGLYIDYVEAKEFTATRAEVRQNAYTAYAPDGSKIGDFITIADAINTCVDYDVEYNSSLKSGQEEVYGSYVTKLGSTFKMFVNHKGFSEDNNDQFWYYENGTSLAAYNCWDGADSITTLQNTNLIAHKVSGFGTVAEQTWNSYALLDAFGEPINDVSAQVWELSSTMDAAVLQFPARLGGITGMKYNIDLSNVSIVPPYDGADSTYAFMGFYAWQDYYVIAIGIACDTRTGNWYPFIGTSRDDSFSDVTYNIGKCLFTSTWSEDGYFRPDVTEVELEIKTLKLHDDEEDEDYQIDDFKVTIDSKLKYERHITDSLLNNYFSGYPLSWENGYVFIAGLDIKNKVVQSQFTESTDYFNGSQFTGLKVTSAKAYVPAKDEISDITYGYPIEDTWRGKWHDILMANTDDTAEVLDYTILNTCVCASYQKVNGCDVYSFSYDGNNASVSELGTKLRSYQAKINALADLDVSDILNDSSLLDEVGSWLVENQTIIPQKYFLCLDFSAYYAAKELFESTSMSAEAKAVVGQLQALSPADYQGFDAIVASTYAALTEDEQNVVRLVFGATAFDNLQELSTFVKSLEEVNGVFVTYQNILYVNGNALTCAKDKSMSVKEAFEQLMWLSNGIANKVQYNQADEFGGINDDPNSGHLTGVMNGDNHFYPSMRIVAIVEFFEGLDIELPAYEKDLLETIGYEDFYTGFYYPIYNTVKLAVSIQTNSKAAISDLSESELAFLNEVWVSSYFISNQIVWNWNSGNRFLMFYDGRTRAISVEAGGDISVAVKDYFAVVANFLEDCGYTVQGNGWGVTATTIQ
ncbi:MAG: hypothetical protein J6T34_00795 [Bacilli bacterium]|nr:hypothetical protein [Bacilli bacterium]